MYKIVQASPNEYILNKGISIVEKGSLSSPLYLIDTNEKYWNGFDENSDGNEITVGFSDFSLADMSFKSEQRIYSDAPFCVEFFTISKSDFFSQIPAIKWLIDSDIEFRIKSWTPNTITVAIETSTNATMFKTKFT